MMSEQISGWRHTSEDNLSTGSNQSDSSLTNTESLPLRFPTVRRVAVNPKAKMGAIALGSFSVLVICGVLFGGVYSMTSGGPARRVYESLDVVHKNGKNIILPGPLADIDESNSLDNVMLGDDPQRRVPSQYSGGTRSSVSRNSYQNIVVPDRQKPLKLQTVETKSKSSQVSSQGSSSTLSSSTSKPESSSRRPKRRNKSQRQGPMRLPADAKVKHPLSLLYQLKLVSGPAKSFVNYTKCEEDVFGKKIFKGWKAAFSVNATVAGTNLTKNYFEGYGEEQREARAHAAQQALMTLYPGKLEYERADVSDISEFCGDGEE